MTLPLINADALREPPTWAGAVNALAAGHRLPRAQISDTTLARGTQRLMSRMAWIENLGALTKTFTVYPDNPSQQRPTVQGACLLFDAESGAPTAMLDFRLLTWWKTAADSVLGALLLGPATPSKLVVIGAGQVARSLCEAYPAMFPSLESIVVTTRRPEAAAALLEQLSQTKAIRESVSVTSSTIAEEAVSDACIVATATSSEKPVLHGEWLRDDAHVDLVGAFAATMREADDALIKRGRLYVDSRETTLEHIGELKIPLENGVIEASDVAGDLYDLLGSADRAIGTRFPEPREQITVMKNGGGAHLDLMMGRYLHSLMK